MNYFEKGVDRTSSTARIPKEVHKNLSDFKDTINERSSLNVSLNDLVTIGAIIVAKTSAKDLDGLNNLNSYSDLLELLEKNIGAK